MNINKNIKLISLLNFFTDFNFYSAILVIYFAKVTGSYASAMSLLSVTMVSSAVFEIPTGIFSDYLGRKKTVVIGAFCGLLSVIFYAIGISYFYLLIGALLEGLRLALYSGNNNALLYDTLSSTSKKDEYDHYLGRTNSMFQFSAAVSIIIGGFIAVYSFQIVLWLSVIPQIICIYISLKIVDPPKKYEQSTNIYQHLSSAFSLIWINKELKMLSVSSVIRFAVGEASYQFRSVFINTLWPIWAVGLSRVLSSVGAAISYWYSGKLIQKFGSFRLLLISNIYSKVVGILSVLFPNIFSPILMSSTSIFYGATNVAENKLMQKNFIDEQRATLGSLNSFLGNLTFGLFSIILGIFADKYGAANALLFASIISLPTIWINWILFNDKKNK